MELICVNCDWVGDEDDLSIIECDINDMTEEATAVETGHIVTRLKPQPDNPTFFKGCPNCHTDEYLKNNEE